MGSPCQGRRFTVSQGKKVNYSLPTAFLILKLVIHEIEFQSFFLFGISFPQRFDSF
jgi:hypothetical protein